MIEQRYQMIFYENYLSGAENCMHCKYHVVFQIDLHGRWSQDSIQFLFP